LLEDSFGFVVAAQAAKDEAKLVEGRREYGLAADRADDLAAAALVALGLEGDFALTARFALFAAGFAFERDADRLNPFVRLLLMGGISKGCSRIASSRRSRAQLTIGLPLNQRTQVFAGALSSFGKVHFDKRANKEKHLMHIVGYVKVRLAYGGLRHLGTSPQPNK